MLNMDLTYEISDLTEICLQPGQQVEDRRGGVAIGIDAGFIDPDLEEGIVEKVSSDTSAHSDEKRRQEIVCRI